MTTDTAAAGLPEDALKALRFGFLDAPEAAEEAPPPGATSHVLLRQAEEGSAIARLCHLRAARGLHLDQTSLKDGT